MLLLLAQNAFERKRLAHKALELLLTVLNISKYDTYVTLADDRRLYGRTDSGQTDGQLNGETDGWTEGWTDGQRVGQTEG